MEVSANAQITSYFLNGSATFLTIGDKLESIIKINKNECVTSNVILPAILKGFGEAFTRTVHTYCNIPCDGLPIINYRFLREAITTNNVGQCLLNSSRAVKEYLSNQEGADLPLLKPLIFHTLFDVIKPIAVFFNTGFVAESYKREFDTVRSLVDNYIDILVQKKLGISGPIQQRPNQDDLTQEAEKEDNSEPMHDETNAANNNPNLPEQSVTPLLPVIPAPALPLFVVAQAAQANHTAGLKPAETAPQISSTPELTMTEKTADKQTPQAQPQSTQSLSAEPTTLNAQPISNAPELMIIEKPHEAQQQPPQSVVIAEQQPATTTAISVDQESTERSAKKPRLLNEEQPKQQQTDQIKLKDDSLKPQVSTRQEIWSTVIAQTVKSKSPDLNVKEYAAKVREKLNLEQTKKMRDFLKTKIAQLSSTEWFARNFLNLDQTDTALFFESIGNEQQSAPSINNFEMLLLTQKIAQLIAAQSIEQFTKTTFCSALSQKNLPEKELKILQQFLATHASKVTERKQWQFFAYDLLRLDNYYSNLLFNVLSEEPVDDELLEDAIAVGKNSIDEKAN